MQKEKLYRILQHIAFWLFYVVAFGVVFGNFHNDYFWLFVSTISILPVQMFMVYFTNYYLVKLFFNKQAYVKLFFSIALLLLLVTPIGRVIILLINGAEVTPANIISFALFDYYLESGICVFAALSIKLFKERNREILEKELIVKQKIEAELLALKNQLDTHFLFNTLNTLYGLARKKSDLAPKGILMLSEMLSFMLYECKANYYKLGKEIEVISNYIELQKLRFGDRITISFEKTVINNDFLIAPLLFFGFVENSMKHCSSKQNAPLWINISISTDCEKLIFIVENSTGLFLLNSNNEEGIGIENAKKRLSLLYSKNHEIDIENREGSFYVCLKIYIK